MKRLIAVMMVIVFLAAACTPATAPPAPTTPPEAPPAQPAQPTTPPAAPQPAGAYTPPEGGLAPVPVKEGVQASCTNLAYKPGKTPKIAYMPPATEFNYYMAIGAGIKALAEGGKADTFMLAPQSGSDIAGQMKMLQDVMAQGVDAIIFSTHDEQAAAPLVKQAVDKGIAFVIVNSDIPDFPTPINAVVGYSQRKGTTKLGDYAAKMVNGKAVVGVLEGQPGYHSTERIGGFLDAFKNYPDMKVVASLPTAWNVETGNKAMMDMLQAHPEINLVVAANDYEAIGAAKAMEALNRKDILLFGNDGDTTGMEEIYAGRWTATVNTTPFVMGKVALQVTLDCLNGVYPGGFTETPTVIVDKNNAADYLCHPENLDPKPSKAYECGAAPAAAAETGYKPPEGAIAPVPVKEGVQASCTNLAFKPGKVPKIAYMPPATEFNYYMAIGAGIKSLAEGGKADTFMLAPQSGSDIAGQMKMLQDVMTQGVDAIIFSTHDEKAAAPLVKQAVDKGIAFVIVNSDIPDFPTPINAVVGYSQRKGTTTLGEYAAKMVNGKAVVGVLEGQPGYHSTERIGGFLDAFKNYPDMKVVASLPTAWNVETGNKAMMDMLQAHPEITLVVAANDYEAIGAAKAMEALNRKDILLFGNDGDTTGMEEIYAGRWTATVNTTPFVMGKIALQVTLDCLNGTYPGGFTETPTITVDKNNAVEYLCHPENLDPKPSKEYKCP